MNYTAFVKSQFDNLGIEDVLKSSPVVLLGVNRDTEACLDSARIKSVFDLALSTIFGNASRVLANAADVASTYRKFGRAPASIVDPGVVSLDTVPVLPLEDLRALVGVTAALQADMISRMSVAKVRDLALWPPYLAAKAIVVEAYNPTVGDQADPEAPPELVPASGEFGTERHLYSSIVMFPGKYDVNTPLQNTLFDITAAKLIGFQHMRFGARVTYSQTWFPKFVAKGQLLHSLPLAPGESTNVAVIDWSNKSKAATEQTLSESERLSSTNDRTRTISQVANSVANDFESGASESYGQSAAASTGGTAFLGIGVGSASASVNETSSGTHTVSTGSRNITTALHENLLDSTQQHSSSVRAQRAAVVSEVSQSDSKSLSTRNITNYNHMHALTLQYYEVVQIYDTEVRIEDVERCIFIPMSLFDFTDERVLFKYVSILKRAALTYETRTMLGQLEATGQGYTAKWLPRIPPSVASQPIVQTWATGVVQGYRTLASRGFLRPPPAGAPTDVVKANLLLDFELQLNNVVVLQSRNQAPRSMVTNILVELENGQKITIPTPALAAAPAASDLAPAFGGKPISFGKIRSIRLKTTSYTPASPDERLVRVLLAVKQRGESRFLDAGFVMAGTSSAYSNKALLDLPPIPGIQLLEQDLMEHQLHYSQAIWLQQNPQTMVMQFAPLFLTLGGRPVHLVDFLSPMPLKVVGNYLVFKFSYEADPEWQRWKKEYVDWSKVTVDAVAIPTGGVFAEAVLGRFNAAEKLDITRFANWSDSPPPKPPEISPVKFNEPGNPTLPAQATFAAPVVSIQNPITLPSPSGLADALAAVVKGASFPDVSGIAQTGDAGTKATEAASADSIAAMKASGDAFAQMISSISNVLQTAVSKDATKTLSDVGALLNKKSGDDKSQAAGTKGGDGTTGDGAKTPEQLKASEAQVVQDAVSGSALASLASGETGATATDATQPGITAISGDKALLSSNLIKDPLFTDVTGFLVLMQLLPDDNLLDVVKERFGNLDKSIDPKAKYGELLAAFNTNSAQLTGADRILFALRFQKGSVLPDTSGLDADQIKRVLELATTQMATRAFTVARRVSSGAKSVMEQLFTAVHDALHYDLNHIAYMLATAYHESAMGAFMTEIANGVSTDALFTKDEYFFSAIAGKKRSYNGINGNKLAGDQLKADGTISAAADVTLWNGSVYPNAQTSAVKKAARGCDFYRFIGRGLVQITGRDNYKRYSSKAEFGGGDFEASPDLVTDPSVAARILVRGMLRGDFRGGHKLADYDLAGGFDGVNARDIVNGDVGTWGAPLRDIAQEFKTNLVINDKLDESIKIV